MDNTILRDGKIYTLTADKHEKVSFLMQAGKDIVRNVMSLDGAMRILRDAVSITHEPEKYPNYPICVDLTFYFPGTVAEDDLPFLQEEPQEVPQPKHHGFNKKRK